MESRQITLEQLMKLLDQLGTEDIARARFAADTLDSTQPGFYDVLMERLPENVRTVVTGFIQYEYDRRHDLTVKMFNENEKFQDYFNGTNANIEPLVFVPGMSDEAFELQLREKIDQINKVRSELGKGDIEFYADSGKLSADFVEQFKRQGVKISPNALTNAAVLVQQLQRFELIDMNLGKNKPLKADKDKFDLFSGLANNMLVEAYEQVSGLSDMRRKIKAMTDELYEQKWNLNLELNKAKKAHESGEMSAKELEEVQGRYDAVVAEIKHCETKSELAQQFNGLNAEIQDLTASKSKEVAAQVDQVYLGEIKSRQQDRAGKDQSQVADEMLEIMSAQRRAIKESQQARLVGRQGRRYSDPNAAAEELMRLRAQESERFKQDDKKVQRQKSAAKMLRKAKRKESAGKIKRKFSSGVLGIMDKLRGGSEEQDARVSKTSPASFDTGEKDKIPEVLRGQLEDVRDLHKNSAEDDIKEKKKEDVGLSTGDNAADLGQASDLSEEENLEQGDKLDGSRKGLK